MRRDPTHANYTQTQKEKVWGGGGEPATQRAECIFGGQSYFSRHVSVIIIPGVAHVWSQRAVEQRGARSAQSGMCLRVDDGESRCCDWGQASAREVERKRDGGEWREGGSSNEDCESSLTLFPWLDPDSVWLVFISTSVAVWSGGLVCHAPGLSAGLCLCLMESGSD